ncbi:MAG: hypothetical protein RsTaC01_0168 [Candidatus Paraimprobicoccus trichonymphae]|uniref:Calpain catalytic domain-containing protein n=1 Tax=Candidatus Paraimprobicoccus trichonymphae TaxID=3033793 RepID=A0AA48IH94_9FIRM|nr:MAG: hypothetical protein RsTaC01_0168 [Candidatus Paraimprobicoccus trichonymphae]
MKFKGSIKKININELNKEIDNEIEKILNKNDKMAVEKAVKLIITNINGIGGMQIKNDDLGKIKIIINNLLFENYKLFTREDPHFIIIKSHFNRIVEYYEDNNGISISDVNKYKQNLILYTQKYIRKQIKTPNNDKIDYKVALHLLYAITEIIISILDIIGRAKIEFKDENFVVKGFEFVNIFDDISDPEIFKKNFLFPNNGPHFFDIRQNEFEDCFLESIISSASKFNAKAISDCFGKINMKNKKITMKFFRVDIQYESEKRTYHCIPGVPMIIKFDISVYVKDIGHGYIIPGSFNGNKNSQAWWPFFIEKGIAIFLKSGGVESEIPGIAAEYSRSSLSTMEELLRGGRGAAIITAITGKKCKTIFNKNKIRLSGIVGQDSDGNDITKITSVIRTKDIDTGEDIQKKFPDPDKYSDYAIKIYNKIEKCIKNNGAASVDFVKGGKTGSKRNNLIIEHSYSILGTFEDSDKHKYIILRNPHAKDETMQYEFNKKSLTWKRSKLIKLSKDEDYGIFNMELADFIRHFGGIDYQTKN